MSHHVLEFHNIMPVTNILSVLNHGILSHEKAAALPHSDFSMADVQDRRDKVQVPGGLRLHQYANLVFDARNPMMYKRKEWADQLCVLSISTNVLTIQGVVLADRNAASDYARFFPPNSLEDLDFDKIYADDWRHPNDSIAYLRHKSAKCAEVLVPNSIPADYIQKASVASDAVRTHLSSNGFSKPVEVLPKLFFG